MKIWILTCELAHEVAGGIARYVENFSRLAGAAGHEVLVIGRAESACDLRPSPNVRVLGFEHGWKRLCEGGSPDRPDEHPGYPYNVVGYAQALSYELSERVLKLLNELPPPDVIECHEYMGLPYYLLQRKLTERSKLDGIPVVIHMHGPLHELLRVNQEPRFRFPAWFTGEMEKACVAMADAVVSPSFFLANRIKEILGDDFRGDITRIPYPVDALADGAASNPQPREVLYVGRLQLLKGILPMLAACERMWLAGGDFSLTLIGGDTTFTARNTSMREYIGRKYKRWIDSGRLVMPGPMPYAQVLERMRSAWTVLVPSLWENFPNVCIEAMLSGAIVLGSTSGGQAEMIASDGENGFLFDWNRPGDFERKLTHVLELDPSRRTEIAERARERIRALCSPQGVVRDRIAHFERIISEYKPRTEYPSLQALQRRRTPTNRAAVPASWAAPGPATPPRESVPGLLSVVIPFYNLGAYVRETIQSIDRSTYEPREIILVNDGSTDEQSLDVVREIEREGRGDLRIVHTANSGLAQTRNNGADHARGEFLCFLDADDCVEPHYFARATDVLKRFANLDFVSSWIRYFGETSGMWPVFDASLPYLLGHNMCTAFSVIRRSSFERWGRNKPVVEYALEDHEMWISMLEGGAVGLALPHPLVRYRVRKNSMLQTSGAVQQMYLYDVITQLHPELYREWGVELFNLQLSNNTARLWNNPACEVGESSPQQYNELHSWLKEVEKAREWSESQRLRNISVIQDQDRQLADLRASVERGTVALRGAGARPRTLPLPIPESGDPAAVRRICPDFPNYDCTPASPSRPKFEYRQAESGEPPRVSIVTPFWNHAGPVFEETAASILRQSFQAWEWLIINDAATNPEALAILDRYRRLDPRIRVIDHEENKGLSGARNTGFAEARAELVFLIDDDDLIEPTAIEKLFWHMQSYPQFGAANGWSIGFGAKQYLWPQGFERSAGLLESNSATGRAMVRRDAHRAAGGYDESMRQGMEDWDFWMRLANQGLWGSTIPEFLDWYRRREDHTDRWADLDGQRVANYRGQIRQRYPRLFEPGGFPRISPKRWTPFERVRWELPAENALAKSGRRVLMIVPWLTVGGADKFNLDLVGQLTRLGWEVSIATTMDGDHSWMPEFARLTPDIFPMASFLRPIDYPAFLRYLIQSRQIDVVMVTNSELGYQLLPYLRGLCPKTAFVDYVHSEHPGWKDGGYARYATANQDLLELNIVASEYLKGYERERGGEPGKIEVAHINIDAELWRPDAAARRRFRARYGVGEAENVIIFAGRMHADKRPHVLAKILERLRGRGISFTALIVGDGPEREWFDSYCRDAGMRANVRSLGALASDDVREAFQASDLLLLPSRWEGIALTIYEAMACGLPVVGADVGGQRELCTPECGVLIPRGNESAEIERYVNEVAGLLADGPRRAAMGQAARQRVLENFRIEHMGRRMTELFERAIRAKAETPGPWIPWKFAHESATLAIEALRVAQLSEEQQERLCAVGAATFHSAATFDGELGADDELRYIENSRFWRMVQRAKRNAVYRAVARMRWGTDWNDSPRDEDARQRLQRIKSSNAYRLIQAVKATPIYRWYARNKYGPDGGP